MANKWRNNGNSGWPYFGGSKITAGGDCNHEIKRCLLLGRKVMANLDSILKSRDITFPTNMNSQSYNFSSSHVWMWELDHKESWAVKNCCFWTVVLEKALESLLDCKDIQPVHPKGNQSWIFTGRTDTEAETPIFLATWCKEPTHFKRPWCWERLKVGGEGDNREWHGWMASLTQWTWVWVSSRSWGWTGSLACCSPWGRGVGHDWATELNWTLPFCWCLLFFFP